MLLLPVTFGICLVFAMKLISWKFGFRINIERSDILTKTQRLGFDCCWSVRTILIEWRRWYLNRDHGENDNNNKIGRSLMVWDHVRICQDREIKTFTIYRFYEKVWNSFPLSTPLTISSHFRFPPLDSIIFWIVKFHYK